MLRGTGAHAFAAFRGADSGAAKLIVDADEVELIREQDREPLDYQVRLHFGLPRDCMDGQREFSVTINDQLRSSNWMLAPNARPRCCSIAFP